jgi:hypothetical protein
MTQVPRFSQLSPARQNLVRLCQQTNFGYLHDLVVRNHEPVLADPPPRVLADVRLDVDEQPRPEASLGDFSLCTEFCRLLARLDHMVSGIIPSIEIRAGVPRRMILQRSVGEMELANESKRND